MSTEQNNKIKGLEKIVEEKFNNWNSLKKEIHFKLKRVSVNRGDVWWGKIGQNIGVETYGKNENFSRPILIIKPIEGGNNAIGIPITSKKHIGTWYAHFILNKLDQYAILPQTRSIDTARLYQRIGELSEEVTDLITKQYIDYLLNKK